MSACFWFGHAPRHYLTARQCAQDWFECRRCEKLISWDSMPIEVLAKVNQVRAKLSAANPAATSRTGTPER